MCVAAQLSLWRLVFSLYEDISGRQGYFLESQNYFLTFALWRKTVASSKVGPFLRGTCLFLFFCIKWGHFLRNSQAGPQAGPSEGCFRKAIQHKIFAKSNMCVISKSDHCCPVRTLVWKTRALSEILTLGQTFNSLFEGSHTRFCRTLFRSC